MKSYLITAHLKEKSPFHITYKAWTCAHAGAQFIADMKARKTSVVIEKASGYLEYLSPEKFKVLVVLDRINSVA